MVSQNQICLLYKAPRCARKSARPKKVSARLPLVLGQLGVFLLLLSRVGLATEEEEPPLGRLFLLLVLLGSLGWLFLLGLLLGILLLWLLGFGLLFLLLFRGSCLLLFLGLLLRRCDLLLLRDGSDLGLDLLDRLDLLGRRLGDLSVVRDDELKADVDQIEVLQLALVQPLDFFQVLLGVVANVFHEKVAESLIFLLDDGRSRSLLGPRLQGRALRFREL